MWSRDEGEGRAFSLNIRKIAVPSETDCSVLTAEIVREDALT